DAVGELLLLIRGEQLGLVDLPQVGLQGRLHRGTSRPTWSCHGEVPRRIEATITQQSQTSLPGPLDWVSSLAWNRLERRGVKFAAAGDGAPARPEHLLLSRQDTKAA